MDKLKIVNNSIKEGICEDILKAQRANMPRGALILVYCGIDAMAFLNMPISQNEVTRSDFIDWVDQYMSIKNKKYPANDLYSGRCALVHSYGVASKSSRVGRTRLVGYQVGVKEAHDFNNTALIMINIDLFIKDFLNGVVRFFETANNDTILMQKINDRIPELICIFPFGNI